MGNKTLCTLYPKKGVDSLCFGESPEKSEIWPEFSESSELSEYSGGCIVYTHIASGLTVYVCAGVIDRILLTSTCCVNDVDLIGSTVSDVEKHLGYRAIMEDELEELSSGKEAVYEISELGIQLWESIDSHLIQAIFAEAG